MAKLLDKDEIISFKELLIANSIETDALAQLLVDKGIITEHELYAKLSEVQQEYENTKKYDN